MKKLILAAVAAILCSCSSPDGWVSLFNGNNLDGWGFALEGDEIQASEVFTVRDGMIHIGGNPFGYMYTEAEYSNYDLEVEWAWDGAGSNSGVFLNIEALTAPFPNCIECNLMKDKAGLFVLLGGGMAEEYVLPEDGILPQFPVIAMKSEPNEKADGEWNLTRIEVREGHIKVYMNDQFMNECTDLCKKGRIGLQSEGGPIWFRSVRIKTY